MAITIQTNSSSDRRCGPDRAHAARRRSGAATTDWSKNDEAENDWFDGPGSDDSPVDVPAGAGSARQWIISDLFRHLHRVLRYRRAFCPFVTRSEPDLC